jgi:hypothetical protein
MELLWYGLEADTSSLPSFSCLASTLVHPCPESQGGRDLRLQFPMEEKGPITYHLSPPPCRASEAALSAPPGIFYPHISLLDVEVPSSTRMGMISLEPQNWPSCDFE